MIQVVVVLHVRVTVLAAARVTITAVAVVIVMHTEVAVVNHNCVGPPFLFVEGLLSTGPTPSSFYLLVGMGLPLHLYPAFIW